MRRKKFDINVLIFSIVFMVFGVLFGLFEYVPDVKSDMPILTMKEKDYVNKFCTTGKIEYILPDKTRVDCLTDEYAIEFDYAKKWAESIGQSLYYSVQTGKKPAVAIILKSPDEIKYVKRIQAADKNIKIFEIKAYEEDFSPIF